MNNLKLVCFLFICCFIGITSCNQSDNVYSTNEIVKTDISQYRIFNNEKHGYQINIPLDWHYKFKKNTILIAQKPHGNKKEFRETLDVVVLDSGFKYQDGKYKNNTSLDLDVFFSEHMESLENTDYNTAVQHKGEKVINGKRSKWAILKDKDEKNNLRVMKYFVSDEKKIYIISCSMMEQQFPEVGPVFNEIVESFKVI